MSQLIKSDQLAPERIGRRVDQGHRWPTAEIYELGQDHVLLAHINTIKTVRKIHLQGVLDHLQIPHLKVRQDTVALQLASESGIIIRERIPDGAKSLDQIARDYFCDVWEDVEHAVRTSYGDAAVGALSQIKEQIHAANNDHALASSARRMGYIELSGAIMPSENVIDYFGNGGIYGEPYWSTNLYYHPDRGWFLINW